MAMDQIQNPSRLNPDAESFEHPEERGTERARSVYVTFSNGYPLTHLQIRNYFNRAFGKCVERVYIHYDEDPSKKPLFGKVVFYSRSIVWMMLRDRAVSHHMIEGRSIWCKNYKKKSKCLKFS